MQNKLTLALIFGGKSAEHEVSVRSARGVWDAVDPTQYNPILIGVAKDGTWFLHDTFDTPGDRVALLPGGDGDLVNLTHPDKKLHIDVVFPLIHGVNGEDGTLQGLLQLAHVPYVGAGVLGSAIGMDKDVMKRLLRDAGIPIGKFVVYRNKDAVAFNTVSHDLGLPLFIKPANTGSSVGINKVHTKEEFERAVADAFRFDAKIIIEACINGREIECSVLGNDDPIVSVPGEIIVGEEFYSYEAKYSPTSKTTTAAPAQLEDVIIKKVQQLAIRTFKALGCAGMARVDFFLTDTGDLYVNELNTIPGFTSISMYPKLWEASGTDLPHLIDKLVELAFERFVTQNSALG